MPGPGASERWGCELWITPVYYPRANPMERRNQEVKKALQLRLHPGNQRTWHQHLTQLLYGLRGRTNSATCATKMPVIRPRNGRGDPMRPERDKRKTDQATTQVTGLTYRTTNFRIKLLVTTPSWLKGSFNRKAAASMLFRRPTPRISCQKRKIPTAPGGPNRLRLGVPGVYRDA